MPQGFRVSAFNVIDYNSFFFFFLPYCTSSLQTVYAVPILTFAFVCHPAILPMYEELKE